MKTQIAFIEALIGALIGAIFGALLFVGSAWALEPGTVTTQAPAAAPEPGAAPAVDTGLSGAVSPSTPSAPAAAPAATPASGESDSGDEDAPARPVRVVHSSSVKSKGGNRAREKDADGTEAPNRFQADTVIKSQYKLNGQPLEVDPD